MRLAGVAALAALLLLAAPARAATVDSHERYPYPPFHGESVMEPGDIDTAVSVLDEDGVANRLHIAREADGTVVVKDDATPLRARPTADNTCAVSDDGAVRCSVDARRYVLVVVHGGDGDDTVDVAVDPGIASRTVGVWLYGDGGADRLIGTAAGDILIGGPGSDTLAGLAGDDDFPGNDADGADAIDGGDGSDSASYTNRAIVTAYDGAARPGAAIVDLASTRPQPGAGGDRLSSIENATGGRLSGTGAANRLTGDDILGRAGDDTLEISKPGGSARCGGGRDSVAVDGAAVRHAKISRDCETVVAGRQVSGVVLSITRLAGRTLSLRARRQDCFYCPHPTAATTVSVALAVTAGGRRVGTARLAAYRLASAPRAKLRLRLTRAGRRLLRRRAHPRILIAFDVSAYRPDPGLSRRQRLTWSTTLP